MAVAGEPAVSLPSVTVYSERVANQAPAGTFAMPVSALRYEPGVDIHARNLAEGQADLTIRGGIFENTGIRLGALTVMDPQTGHYLAEMPVAPAMLGAPEILTGAELATSTTNATSGAVSYGWRPIRTGGFVALGAGEYKLRRAEVYQGYVNETAVAGYRVGMDVDVAHSDSDGSIPRGDHRFDRVAGRLQLARGQNLTNFFAGYQAKFFGWRNLYTPFNSNESENLQTLLFAADHRVELGGDNFVAAAVFHRRNKDDYAFNRFAPVGAVHPFQHTARLSGAAVEGRQAAESFTVNYRGEIMTDRIASTSLTAGRYRSRRLTKLAVIPETQWQGSDAAIVILKAGATFDASNRDGSVWSPVVELARVAKDRPLRRVHFGYSSATQVATYTALNSSATAGLFRGNANLGRTRSHNFELGATGEGAGWSTRGAFFWRRDDRLVDWTFRRGVTARAANAVDIETAGFEAVARRPWAAGEFVFGYTALTKDADYRGAAVDASFYALNYARHRITAAVTWRIGRGFELRMDNVARIQASNLLRTIGGDDAIVSALGISYRPRAWKGVEASVQVDNLWDSDFQDVPAVPAARRQISAGLAYRW